MHVRSGPWLAVSLPHHAHRDACTTSQQSHWEDRGTRTRHAHQARAPGTCTRHAHQARAPGTRTSCLIRGTRHVPRARWSVIRGACATGPGPRSLVVRPSATDHGPWWYVLAPRITDHGPRTVKPSVYRDPSQLRLFVQVPFSVCSRSVPRPTQLARRVKDRVGRKRCWKIL